ncbi:MAG: YtxH domain-containing protein [Saprospiraceae bacterium]|nr:YtxH domain-containing protein [Saprospiraceae bacterium]
MSKSNILIGVIAGVALGALLGVLFAPTKGSKTRKKISKKALETSEDLKLRLEDLLDIISETLDNKKTETPKDEMQ